MPAGSAPEGVTDDGLEHDAVRCVREPFAEADVQLDPVPGEYVERLEDVMLLQTQRQERLHRSKRRVVLEAERDSAQLELRHRARLELRALAGCRGGERHSDAGIEGEQEAIVFPADDGPHFRTPACGIV